jgi:hypothetical protein
MEKCDKCGISLTEESRCSCEPTVCYHCCSCGPECKCGCKAKNEIEKDESEQ